MKKTLASLALLVACSLAAAQSTPVGLWKTIDDDGKTEKSLVRISEHAGVLTGTIEKLFDASRQDVKCELCSDDRKDKPVLGMQIIRGVKQDSSDASLWTGARFWTPNKGKTYKTRLHPIEGGKKLEMRGYIGFLYRTQVWVRVE